MSYSTGLYYEEKSSNMDYQKLAIKLYELQQLDRIDDYDYDVEVVRYDIVPNEAQSILADIIIVTPEKAIEQPRTRYFKPYLDDTLTSEKCKARFEKEKSKYKEKNTRRRDNFYTISGASLNTNYYVGSDVTATVSSGGGSLSETTLNAMLPATSAQQLREYERERQRMMEHELLRERERVQAQRRNRNTLPRSAVPQFIDEIAVDSNASALINEIEVSGLIDRVTNQRGEIQTQVLDPIEYDPFAPDESE